MVLLHFDSRQGACQSSASDDFDRLDAREAAEEVGAQNVEPNCEDKHTVASLLTRFRWGGTREEEEEEESSLLLPLFPS